MPFCLRQFAFLDPDLEKLNVFLKASHMADPKYSESLTNFILYHKTKRGKRFIKPSLIIILSNRLMDL